MLSTLIEENALFRNKLYRARTWPDATSMVEEFVEECGVEAVRVLLPKFDDPLYESKVLVQFVSGVALGREPTIDARIARVMVALVFDPALRSTLEASIIDKFYSHLKPVPTSPLFNFEGPE